MIEIQLITKSIPTLISFTLCQVLVHTVTYHGEGHRIGEFAEDLLAYDVISGAEAVPQHTQRDDLQGLVEKRFVGHSSPDNTTENN